mgnify:CR=1 FL=1
MMMVSSVTNIKITPIMIKFNERHPVALKELVPQTHDQYPTKFFKNASFRHVYENSNDYVRYVLDNVPIVGNHKRVLVDVKVHDLNEGDHPCIPGWHCDTAMNVNSSTLPEVHHLFVVGDNRTEFLAEPFEWNDSVVNQVTIASTIPEDIKTSIIPNATICRFGRLDFHRGPKATSSCKRLLIRVSETGTASTNNNDFICNTFHK